MAEIRWSLTAGRDLKDIEDWIARDSILHAIRFVDRLVQAAERLADAPRSGRVVPEFQRENLREIILKNYRIVYLLERDRVTILRVVHGARELEDLIPGLD